MLTKGKSIYGWHCPQIWKCSAVHAGCDVEGQGPRATYVKRAIFVLDSNGFNCGVFSSYLSEGRKRQFAIYMTCTPNCGVENYLICFAGSRTLER